MRPITTPTPRSYSWPRTRGSSLIACSASNDVAITLHGQEGEELNRYLVDIHARPIAGRQLCRRETPMSIRRVCVDSADHQVNYLSGGETVGGAIDASATTFTDLTGTITVRLTDTAPGNNYQYFFARSGTTTRYS